MNGINLYQIRTESVIKTIMEGIVGDRGERREQGCYISFRIDLDPVDESKELQERALGIHLIKWGGRIIGAVNRDFLFPTFPGKGKIERKWENISTHDSCWADSTMHWLYEKMQERQEEVGFDLHSTFFNIEQIRAVPVVELVGIVYKDESYGEVKENRPLIPEFMYEELGIEPSRV